MSQWILKGIWFKKNFNVLKGLKSKDLWFKDIPQTIGYLYFYL